MPPEQKYRLGDVLVDQGLISLGQLSKALELQKTDNQRIGKTLVQMKAVAEGDVISALSHQAVFNRKRVASKASNNSHHSSTHPNKKSRILKRAVLILSVLTASAVAIIVLNEQSNKQSPVAYTQPTPIEKVPQPDITTERLSYAGDTNVITEAAVTIHSIDVYESALQQQFIFHASAALIPNVERQYGAGNSVRYLFATAALAGSSAVVNAGDHWIRNAKLSQTSDGLLWTFQLTDPGSAKYHEIAPTTENDRYQFVVVIRKSDD